MFLEGLPPSVSRQSLPRAGGGVSAVRIYYYIYILSSPRRWGCFQIHHLKQLNAMVFPAQVGVFPNGKKKIIHRERLPRAGGGVSHFGGFTPAISKSSPRRWGCFYCNTVSFTDYFVFPAQVGVFLWISCENSKHGSLPRAGGGVSYPGHIGSLLSQSSPRRWGCFLLHEILHGWKGVFPAQVGVFLFLTR